MLPRVRVALDATMSSLKIDELLLKYLLEHNRPASPCAYRIVRTYEAPQGRTEVARRARCPIGMSVEYLGGLEHVVYGWRWVDGPEPGFVWCIFGQGDSPDIARGEAWVTYDDCAQAAQNVVSRVFA